MILDGARRQAEQLGDLPVGISLGEKAQDVELATGQLDRRQAPAVHRRDRLMKQRAGHRGVHVDVAPTHRVDRVDDLGLLGALDHVAGAARPKRLVQQALVLVHGEEQHDDLWMRLLQPLRGLDAVLGRHGDVEQNHVGVQRLGEAQRLGTVARLADDLEIGVGREQGSKAGPDDGVVVSDQDSDRHSTPPPRWWCLPRARFRSSSSHPGLRLVPSARGGRSAPQAESGPARTRRRCPRPSP